MTGGRLRGRYVLGALCADTTPEMRQNIVRLVRAQADEEDAIFIDPDDPGLP